MLVTIEKYDVVKGVTYNRQFELNTDCVIIEKEHLTISIIRGDYKELSILCRDKDYLDFISVTVSDSLSKEFVTYYVDEISYFDNSEIKTLLRQGDIL